MTGNPAEPVIRTSGECDKSGDASLDIDLIRRDETIPEMLQDPCTVDDSSELVIDAAIPRNLSHDSDSWSAPFVPDTPQNLEKDFTSREEPPSQTRRSYGHFVCHGRFAKAADGR
jgi:hypothetical protein